MVMFRGVHVRLVLAVLSDEDLKELFEYILCANQPQLRERVSQAAEEAAGLMRARALLEHVKSSVEKER
jgi:hypothetical protein